MGITRVSRLALPERIKRILLGKVYEEAKKSVRNRRRVSIVGYEEHIELLKKAETVLMDVVIPGYDYDLVTSGALKRLRLSYDKSTLYVVIDYSGSDPGCNFCRFINWQVWRRILEDAESRLKRAGFNRIVFIDWSTNAVIEYHKEDRPAGA